MILNSIKLENIRSYQTEEIEFPRGITLFEGDIGSGKSSVLMGIEFALFGLGSQRPEALLSKKADEGSVTLRFSVDDNSYEIKRILKRRGVSVSQDPQNSYLKEGDVIEPLSPSELKQRVLQILKFNEPADPRSESRIYRYAFFTPQEEMKHILIDSAKRLETIRKAFGVEDYRIVAENAKMIISELKSQMARFEERFKNLSVMDESLRSSNEKILTIVSQLTQFQTEQKEHESQKAAKEKEFDSLRMQEKEKTQLEAQKQTLEERISDSNKEIKKLNTNIQNFTKDVVTLAEKITKLQKIKKPTTKSISQLDSEVKRFRTLKDNLTITSSKINSITERVDELKGNLGNYTKFDVGALNKKLDELNSQINESKSELEKIYGEVESTKEMKIAAETEKKSFDKDLDKIAKLGSKCLYCEREITKDHLEKLEGERKMKLKNIIEEIEKLSSQLAKSKEKVTDLETKISANEEKALEIKNLIPDLQEWSKKCQELDILKQKLEENQAQYVVIPEKSFEVGEMEPADYLEALKDTLAEYQNAEKQIQELENNLKKTEQLKEKCENDVDAAKQKISDSGVTLNAINERLGAFLGFDKKIQELKSLINQTDEKISNCKVKIAAFSENLKNEKSIASKLESDIVEAKKWQTEHLKYSNYNEWIREFFIPTLAQIEKQVLLSIQQQFDETYRRWYSILIEDPTKESRIDDNFTPIVEQDGYMQEVDFLSGGEKTSIALAYRLTLNSLMRKETESMKSNLLILDEPTDGFSKTQLSKVKDVLQELKSEQIILVSHEKELETYVDNIFQISKDGGVSRIARLSN
jgi:exonuclease SbcC